ncbi:MAG: hypothetical protein Q8T08_03295 [Ignavibacteria bacterium]|nr:hypothetical protein [Ignavibacteria bacterium]
MPSHKVIHICKPHEPTHNSKLAKEYAFINAPADRQPDGRKEQRRHNSTYPKGGVSCSKDSFVVNQTLVFQIKFCGKTPALRVAANRYQQV